jgi:oligopeptide transport system substrate-binding protein
MRATKWIFFGYLLFTAVLAGVIAVSFTRTPPRHPQTLYATYLANIKSLDPAVNNDTVGSELLGNVYESLYTFKYKVEPYEVFADLAADMPTVSTDGLVYTVKLRKGIHYYEPAKEVFPDGVGPEVKAQDFVYAWKRVADFHVASPNFSTLFQGKVAGIDEWNEYTEKTPQDKVDYDKPVEGLTALDDYTLQVKLTKPCPQFVYIMAYLGTCPVCRQAVEHYGDRFSNRPVGTGPYYLEEHLPDQRMIFVASPVYRGRPDVDGAARLPAAERLPKIPRLQYDYYREQLPVWYLFQQGLYDLATIPKESFSQAIDPATMDLRPEARAKGMRLSKAAEPDVFYWAFNMTNPMLSRNKPLRQAVSMAFDRETFVRTYLNGRGLPSRGLIPPGFPTYDPNKKNPYAEYNLDAARAKMKEAVAINGGPFPVMKVYMQDTDSETRQWAEFFVSQMRLIGLEVKPEYNTWARYQEIVDSRQTELFMGAWTADYPDEQTFLQLFYGKFAPAGGVNPTGYSNPAFDALYEKAAVMPAGPERLALYKQMLAILDDDCPWAYAFSEIVYRLYHEWLGNYFAMGYGEGYNVYRDIDFGARKRWLAGKR